MINLAAMARRILGAGLILCQIANPLSKLRDFRMHLPSVVNRAILGGNAGVPTFIANHARGRPQSCLQRIVEEFRPRIHSPA